MRFRGFPFLLILVMLLAAACVPQSETVDTVVQLPVEPAEVFVEDEPVAVPTAAPEDTSVDEAVPATEVVEASPPTATATVEAESIEEVVVVEDPTCEVNDALHASDPSTFKMASGDVQLVEFLSLIHI